MTRWGRVAALGFLAVVVMTSAVAWFVWQRLPPQKDVTLFASAFGDIVGPLFAALAFAGLIYTALMQREELLLQRKELRETREELKRTADAQEAAEKALAAQVDVAQLAARLSAAQALYGYYATLDIHASAAGVPFDKAEEHEKQKQEYKAAVAEAAKEMLSVSDALKEKVYEASLSRS